MRRTSVFLALLLLTFAPVTVSEATPSRRVSKAVLATTPALASFQRLLQGEGRSLAEHAVYIESVDQSEPIAAFNEDLPMNPASVIKLATSLAALEALGPDYRFRTEFLARGEFDRKKGELRGDLVLRSGSDPSFSIPDARAVGDALRAMGVRRVTGNLIVAGSFNCNYNTQTDVSAGVFRRQSRLAINGPTIYQPASSVDPSARLDGISLLTIESEPLLRIIYYQNAHSVNAMAEMLAEWVGGADGVRRFLTDQLQMDAGSVTISRASGLDYNRLSARQTVTLLRALVSWLNEHGIEPASLMPIAGIDASTLSDRFADDRFAGSVVAKTGTLHESDGGVAALAGIAYTRARGPVLFAIFDMAEGRRVEHLRKVQDGFLKAALDELGGPRAVALKQERSETPAPAGRIIVSRSEAHAAD